MGRTWSSQSVSDLEKLCWLDIATNAMSLIHVEDVSSILRNILFEHWDEVPQSIEMGHTLARWCASDDDHDIALFARSIIGRILGSARERNDSWVKLAACVSGLAEPDLRADGGDSALLVILIQVTRPYVRSGDIVWVVLRTLCDLDISKTPPRLQNDFCTLWNEVFQKVRRCGFSPGQSRFSKFSTASTFPYIKAPLLAQLHSLFPHTISSQPRFSHLRIHSATLPAITRTRLLAFLSPIYVPFFFPSNQAIHLMNRLARSLVAVVTVSFYNKLKKGISTQDHRFRPTQRHPAKLERPLRGPLGLSTCVPD